MKCPACAKKALKDATECPSCGVVFAKWKQREAAEAAAALAAFESGAAHEARGARTNPWLGRGIAAAIVAAWIIGFSLYLRSQLAHRHVPSGEPAEEYAEIRDPQTGEIRRLLIRRPETVPAQRH